MNRSSTCKEREGVGKGESILQAEGVAAGKVGSWGRAMLVWGKRLGRRGGERGGLRSEGESVAGAPATPG